MDRNFFSLLITLSLFVCSTLAQTNNKDDIQASANAQNQKEPPSKFEPFSPLEHRDTCRSGFSVRKAMRSTLKSETQVKFKDIITNAGGWNSKHHVFSPFCAGTYFFTFHAVSEKEDDFTMALMKNDKYQVTAFGAKGGYHTGSNSALLFLNPGDYVYLQLQGGSIYEHPYEEAYTSFTGILVETF